MSPTAAATNAAPATAAPLAGPAPPRSATARSRTAWLRRAATRPSEAALARAQVYGSAVLAAAGIALALPPVTQELSLHLPPQFAMAAASLALSAGVLFGLWWPRRVIRARVEQETGRPPGSLPPGTDAPARAVEFEFAASLAGGLIVALAVALALLGGYAVGLESWRHWLITRFTYPPWLTQATLAGPALIGLAAAGTLSTVVLVALHGWQRITHGGKPHASALWISLLGGAAGGTAMAIGIAQPVARLLAALLVTLAAGIVAVFRKPAGAAPLESRAAGRAWQPRDYRLLLAAGVLAASIGLGLASSGDDWDAGKAADVLAVLVGLLLGVLAAQALLHAAPAAVRGLSLWFVACAVAWSLPAWGGDERLWEWVRLALVSVFAGGALVIIGQRLAQRSGRIQDALTAAGAAAVIGLSAGVALAAACAWCGAPHVPAALAVLGLAAAGGLALAFEGVLPPAARGIGVAGVIAALALTLFDPGEGSRRERRIAGPGPRISWLAASSGKNTLHIPATLGATRDIDLGGARADVLIVGTSLVTSPPPRVARLPRLLRRCESALRPGGRLVIVAPPAPVARMIIDLQRSGRLMAGTQVYFVRRDGDPGGALVLGEGVPAWIAGQDAAEKRSLQIVPLDGDDDVARLLAAAGWPERVE